VSTFARVAESVDAVSECEKGSIDVGSFGQTFSSILRVARSFRTGEIDDREASGSGRIRESFGFWSLCDGDSENGMRSRGGSVGFGEVDGSIPVS